MAKQKLLKEEIEKKIKEKETIFGIEGMVFSEEEKELTRKYLAGEITDAEYENYGVTRK